MTLRLRRSVMDARDWCDDKRDEARQNDEGRHRRERWWKMDCDGAGRIKFCMANEDANEIGRRWVRDARLGQGSSSKERGGDWSLLPLNRASSSSSFEMWVMHDSREVLPRISSFLITVPRPTSVVGHVNLPPTISAGLRLVFGTDAYYRGQNTTGSH